MSSIILIIEEFLLFLKEWEGVSSIVIISVVMNVDIRFEYFFRRVRLFFMIFSLPYRTKEWSLDMEFLTYLIAPLIFDNGALSPLIISNPIFIKEN